MSDISILANIGPLEAGNEVERKCCGALPKLSFGGLLLAQNIEEDFEKPIHRYVYILLIL
jgi:hypothetical protein